MEEKRCCIRRALNRLGLLLTFAIGPHAATAADDIFEALENRIVQLYQNRSAAVVHVKVATQKPQGSEKKETALTVISGFFISADGKVLTNAIPRKNVVRLWIVKDGISYLAEEIGTDIYSNISLLQVLNLPPNLAPIELQIAESEPRIGSFAVAISSPLDFNPSPSWGLVTGFESQFGELDFPFTYTRVNIPIGPAEGGSPIFNLKGELLGISVAALPELDSGYLVPTNILQQIVSDLESEGRAIYGNVPIKFKETASSRGNAKRVEIKSIESNSQAENAGLKVGDAIIASGNLSIRSVNQLKNLIFFTEPGSFLSMTIDRDGSEKEFALLIVPQDGPRDPLVNADIADQRGESE